MRRRRRTTSAWGPAAVGPEEGSLADSEVALRPAGGGRTVQPQHVAAVAVEDPWAAFYCDSEGEHDEGVISTFLASLAGTSNVEFFCLDGGDDELEAYTSAAGGAATELAAAPASSPVPCRVSRDAEEASDTSAQAKEQERSQHVPAKHMPAEQPPGDAGGGAAQHGQLVAAADAKLDPVVGLNDTRQVGPT